MTTYQQHNNCGIVCGRFSFFLISFFNQVSGGPKIEEYLSIDLLFGSLLLQQAYLDVADDQVGRILDVIDDKNMWDDVLVILTTDHGGDAYR